tara:strand:- start:55 stop:441 length:387 start_codon:yes stop_codon:yes gene_type:complete
MQAGDAMNWLDIPGYDGVYQVRTDGAIRRNYKKFSRIKKPTISKRGYQVVGLWKNNVATLHYIHRLVATAFVPGDTSLTVDHIDGDKLNNSISNLEWVSKSENTKRQHALGLADTGGLCLKWSGWKVK